MTQNLLVEYDFKIRQHFRERKTTDFLTHFSDGCRPVTFHTCPSPAVVGSSATVVPVSLGKPSVAASPAQLVCAIATVRVADSPLSIAEPF